MLSNIDKVLLIDLRNKILSCKKEKIQQKPKDLVKGFYEEHYSKMSSAFKKYFEIRILLTAGLNSVIYKRYIQSQTYLALNKEILDVILMQDSCKNCGKKIQYAIKENQSFLSILKLHKVFCSNFCLSSYTGKQYWKKLKSNKKLYEDHMKKIRNTMISKYGAPTTLQSKELLSKVQKTNIAKYGGLSPTKSKDIAKKISNSLKGRNYAK